MTKISRDSLRLARNAVEVFDTTYVHLDMLRFLKNNESFDPLEFKTLKNLVKKLFRHTSEVISEEFERAREISNYYQPVYESFETDCYLYVRHLYKYRTDKPRFFDIKIHAA